MTDKHNEILSRLDRAITGQTAINATLTTKLDHVIEGHRTTQKVVGRAIDTLKEIEIVIMGTNGNPGLAERVGKCEKEICELKKFKDRIITIITVVQILTTAIYAAVMLAFKAGWF